MIENCRPISTPRRTWPRSEWRVDNGAVVLHLIEILCIFGSAWSTASLGCASRSRPVRAGRLVRENLRPNPLRRETGFDCDEAVGPAHLHASYKPGRRVAAVSTSVIGLSTDSAISSGGTETTCPVADATGCCCDSPEAAAVTVRIEQARCFEAARLGPEHRFTVLHHRPRFRLSGR